MNGVEGKKKKSKKETITIQIIAIVITLVIVTFSLKAFGVFEHEFLEELKSELLSYTPIFFLGISIFIVGFFSLIWWCSRHKGNWKIEFVEKSLIGLGTVIFPYAFFLFILLGSLHGIYGYESTMAVDLNVSVGAMGGVFNSLYGFGESNPIRGLIIFFVVMISFVCLWISDVIGFYKEHLNVEIKKPSQPKHL